MLGMAWPETAVGQYNAREPRVAVGQPPTEGKGGLKQNNLSKALEETDFANFKAIGSTEDKARPEAAAAPHAGA